MILRGIALNSAQAQRNTARNFEHQREKVEEFAVTRDSIEDLILFLNTLFISI
jgi:hypothetical protein